MSFASFVWGEILEDPNLPTKVKHPVIEGNPVFSYGHVDTWWLTLSEGLRLSQRAGRMEDAVPNMVSTRKSRCWTSCSHDIPTFWAIRIHFRPQPLGYLYQLSQWGRLRPQMDWDLSPMREFNSIELWLDTWHLTHLDTHWEGRGRFW